MVKNKKIGLAELIANGEVLEGFPMPEDCGDFPIRIKRDGTWLYQNSPINRKRLCRLLSTVLRLDENGDYWLVTPAERGKITVDDAPWTIVEMKVETKDDLQVLKFKTNLDNWITADKEHHIWLDFAKNGEPSPYIMVRNNIKGLITRSVFYKMMDLVEEVETNDKITLSITSGKDRFKVGTIDKSIL